MQEKKEPSDFWFDVQGRLLCSFAGGLWWFVMVSWWFAVVCESLLVVCGGLWSFPGGLWSFVVVTCFSNYD